MSDLRAVAERLAYGGESMLKELRRVRERLLARCQAAAALFLDDDGLLRPEAETWLEQLGLNNFALETTHVSGDPEQGKINEGRRQLALEIIASAEVDTEELDRLNAEIRSLEND